MKNKILNIDDLLKELVPIVAKLDGPSLDKKINPIIDQLIISNDIKIYTSNYKAAFIHKDKVYLLILPNDIDIVESNMIKYSKFTPKLHKRKEGYLIVQRIYYTKTLNNILDNKTQRDSWDKLVNKVIRRSKNKLHLLSELCKEYFEIAKKLNDITNKHNRNTFNQFINQIDFTKDIQPFNVIFDTKTERWYLVDV